MSGQFEPERNYYTNVGVIVGGLAAVTEIIAFFHSLTSGLSGSGWLIAGIGVAMAIYALVAVAAARAEHLLAAGRAGLALSVVGYVVGVFLMAVLDAERDSLQWTSFALIGVMLAVQGAVYVRASRIDTAHGFDRPAVVRTTSILLVGAAVLGVASAGIAAAVIDFAKGHTTTSVEGALQAVALSGLGVAILDGRRRAVCVSAAALGVMQIGFGVSATLAKSYLFGGALAVFGILAVLLGITLFLRRSTSSAVLLGLGFLSSAVLAWASGLENKPAFAAAFVVLAVALLFASIAAIVVGGGDVLQRSRDFRHWPREIHLGTMVVSLAVAGALPLVPAIARISLRIGDVVAVAGLVAAAILVAVSALVAYAQSSTRQARRVVSKPDSTD